MLLDVCASKVLTIFIVVIVTIAAFSLVQNMIKSYYIKKRAGTWNYMVEKYSDVDDKIYKKTLKKINSHK